MAIPVLIIGKSGSGKSASLRNFKPDEIRLINVIHKPLPFRNHFDDVINSDDYPTVSAAMKSTNKPVTVIDDAGYLITDMFMNQHTKEGRGNGIFTLYNNLADYFWRLVKYAKECSDNRIIYFIMHEDKNDMGDIKPKTIGKLLDEKVCVEGMFTIVLRSLKQDGKYYFATTTDGMDVTKTPMGMFSEPLIDNDLKMVDQTIRKYYGLDGGETSGQSAADRQGGVSEVSGK